MAHPLSSSRGKYVDLNTFRGLGEDPAHRPSYPTDRFTTLASWNYMTADDGTGFRNISWKGVRLLKDPDAHIAYHDLLWEVKPRTIIELGVYSGGSLLWMRDLTRAFGIRTQLHGIERDLGRVCIPADEMDGITLHSGDLNDPAQSFSWLRSVEHPVLLIDDAHCNTFNVLDAALTMFLQAGDYVVIEDTMPLWHRYSPNRLQEIVRSFDGRLELDAHYSTMPGQLSNGVFRVASSPPAISAVDSRPNEKWVDVPVIDIAPLMNGDSEAKAAVAKQIRDACGPGGMGFFYAKNHSVPTAAHSTSVAKFHASMTNEEKFRTALQHYNPANVGYTRAGYYMATTTKANESFCVLNPCFDANHPRIAQPTPMHEANQWPDPKEFAWFRKDQEEHYWRMFEVSQALLRGFSLALGKEESFFDSFFKRETTLSSLSLIRYPFLENYPTVKTAQDGTLLSFDDHYDVSLVTVLYQSQVSNLQVSLADGSWRSIRANDTCFLVNGGTFMEYITHGFFKSPFHRVKLVNAERQSIPYFVNLAHESVVPPFVPFCDAAAPTRAPVPYGTYLAEGLQALIKKNNHT
jgi:isopenicillin-N synthase